MKKIADVILSAHKTVTDGRYIGDVGLATAASTESRTEEQEASFEEFSQGFMPTDGTEAPEDAIQASAASMAAAASIDPSASLESLDNGALPKGDSIVTASPFDVTPRLEDYNAISSEAFTGKDPANLAAVSAGFNYGASKQNAFAEGFFPTVLKPVGTAGVKVILNVDYIMNPYLRNDGAPASAKNGMIPLIRTLSDDEGPLSKNGNALTPVSDRDATLDTYFVKPLERDATDEATGESIKTAPLAVGKEIPLLDISQTAGELARGVMNETDMLDPSVKITALYATVNGESYKFDTTGIGSNTFSYTPAGDNLDLQVSLASRRFPILLNALTQYPDGAAQTEFTDIPAGFKAIYKVIAKGDGHVVDGFISLYANEFTFVEILDANGAVVPTTDANYATYKAAAEKLNPSTIVGFDAKAYLVNDNIRRAGHLLTQREKSTIYPLLPGTPFTVESPVNNLGNIKTDAKLIPTLIKDVVHQVNMNAVLTLKSLVEWLKNAKALSGDLTDVEVVGIARHVITPWIESKTLNLTEAVDSVSSSDRLSDIKAAIESQLIVLAGQMIEESGYGDAVEGDVETIDFCIGTDTVIGGFLGSSIDLGSGRTARIVTSRNNAVRGKVWMAFTDNSSARNDDVNPFILGNYVYVPTLVADTISSNGSATVKRFTVHPQSAHIVNCPIVAELVVTGLDEIVKKAIQYRRDA